MEGNAGSDRMPLLNPKVRKNSFLEVELGYTPEQAMEEAGRCADCSDKTCISGCPLNVNIPAFIAEVARGDFEKAYEIIKERNILPAVCSRVCSVNPKCERACFRRDGGERVSIAALERFVADWHNFNTNYGAEPAKESAAARRIAVIGSGPAGLACAGELAERGYEVTVYEEGPVAGGELAENMPGFRLPESALARDIASLEALGVEIITDSRCGRAEELLEVEGYEAVYIAGRSKLHAEADIKGASLKGVFSADCFLNWVCSKNKEKYYIDAPEFKSKKAVVLGSGAKALDAARSVRRFGAEVTIVSRTAESDMKVGPNELRRAKQEDIGFIFLSSPLELIGRDGHVAGVWCEKLMALGDEKTGFKYIPLYESEFEIRADIVITVADSGREYFETAENGIFSFSGDVPAAEAMSAGKKAAAVIDEYVKSRVRV